MAARSSGIFPRERFDLDASMELGSMSAALPIDPRSIGTIRIVLLGAVIPGGDNITVTVGGKAVVFESTDLDPNGVAIGYLRGSLCNNVNAGYALDGDATVEGVYLDAVENVA